MTDYERGKAAGYAEARQQTVDAISHMRPDGPAQERYQRLVVAAVNAISCPEAEARAQPKGPDPYRSRWDELAARHRPTREPGEDDGDEEIP